MKFLLLPIFVTFIFQESDNRILGRWEIESYEMIERIKQSPEYILSDEIARKKIDKQFEKMLTEAQYDFGEDTLLYSDLKGTTVVTRRALWNLKEDILTIKEIDRDLEREAYIRFISKDSLVLSLIVDGEVGDSNLIFGRVE